MNWILAVCLICVAWISHAGTPCMTSAECDDGNACTVDQCLFNAGVRSCSNTRTRMSCDDGNAGTSGDACRSDGSCLGTPIPCGNGSSCTTADSVTGLCPAGFSSCDDGNLCTTNACQSGSCVNVSIDLDGDTRVGAYLGCTTDCDDADPTTFPSAPEICDGTLDNSCTGDYTALAELEHDFDDDGRTECSGDPDDNDNTNVPVELQQFLIARGPATRIEDLRATLGKPGYE